MISKRYPAQSAIPRAAVPRPPSRGHLSAAGRSSATNSLIGREHRGAALARTLQEARPEISMQPSAPQSRFRRVTAVALAALTVACARAEAAPKPNPEKTVDRAGLTTTDVVERSFPKTLLLTGSLAPNQSASVAADGGGKVVETFVERGTTVKRGQILARLDASEAALAKAEAQAGVDAAHTREQNARLECERAEQLLAKEAISRAAYDQAKANCDGADSNLDLARVHASRAAKRVGDSLVRAPFSGVVVERFVSTGEYVLPGSRVARIIQVDPMRVELSAPEVLSAALAPGQSVSFTVASLPAETFVATVRYIAPAVEDRSRNLTVEALIDRPDPRLRPGMFATTRLVIAREKALAVPERAIGGDRSSPRAWVLSGDRIEERVLSLGERDDTMTMVKKGLAAGERVVVGPSPVLQDGLRVR
jgi:membrane fusion protein (multidrug efflux system)